MTTEEFSTSLTSSTLKCRNYYLVRRGGWRRDGEEWWANIHDEGWHLTEAEALKEAKERNAFANNINSSLRYCIIKVTEEEVVYG